VRSETLKLLWEDTRRRLVEWLPSKCEAPSLHPSSTKRKKKKPQKTKKQTLEDIGIGNYFLDRNLIAQEIGARIKKWD
jgi:hypothetical protein